MTAGALARDFRGALANPEGRLGSKKLGPWVGWTQPDASQLWLCFDGGANPDGEAQWGPPDTVIIYQWLPNATLVRSDLNACTSFTVARNVASMTIVPDLSFLNIQLTFAYRNVTRACTFIARLP